MPRPRPDFFYRCFPCGVASKQLHCLIKVHDVVEGRKSFPSGHTSFAFCSLGFLSLWLYGKLKTAFRNLRVEIFCMLPLALATLIGVSRCCDNHHHWEDVVAGGILGFSSSYFCYKVYCKPADHLCE
ncbi:jg13745 [Pararge aegeria aegeria]|uniref:Jg13745 protein n=1 Tax=Pararge aegeria aegeria TaxID=348720 RepID=A0A8S4QSJ3_9NEOP|nr:jg13745 [Pararge aegeria aegeria]